MKVDLALYECSSCHTWQKLGRGRRHVIVWKCPKCGKVNGVPDAERIDEPMPYRRSHLLADALADVAPSDTWLTIMDLITIIKDGMGQDISYTALRTALQHSQRWESWTSVDGSVLYRIRRGPR